MQILYKQENLKQLHSIACACSGVSDSLRPHELQPIRLLGPWNFPGKNYWSGLPFSSPGGLPDPGIEFRSPAFQADSLPSEPPGNPENRLRATKSTCQMSYNKQVNRI